MNKKAQELSIGTLILIVLGIVVLVLLILGFSIGWQNLFSKIGIYQNSDLSAMVSACQLAIASQSQSSFCEFKKVTLSTGTENLNCEDSRIKSSLKDNSLSCSSSVQKTACITTIKNKGSLEDRYNGQNCAQILSLTVSANTNCEEVVANGIKAQNKGACTAADIDITSYVKAPTTGKCCITI